MCCLTIRGAEISIKRILIFYQHICHVVTWGLEIITILVSSKIGSINDWALESSKAKNWILSKKSRQSDNEENLISKYGTPVMLNFLQT